MNRDFTNAGKKVKAKYTIRGYVEIPGGWRGEILHEQENTIGGNLVYVLWEASGKSSPVFPQDIELET